MPDVLSMLDAKARGLTRYFTGKSCPRGHVAERMVSTRACSHCLSEKRATWRAENPEKVNAQKRVWRDANLEKARALNLANQKLHRTSANIRNRRYTERNSEEVGARRREWAKRNPHIGAAKTSRRRAAELRRTPAWADQAAIGEFYRRAAIFREFGFDVHVDHEIPLQGKTVSGLHVPDNLQIIDAKVNQSKSNRF